MGTASTEQYCLRWNDFQANLAGAFADLRDEEELLDVTLVCEGRFLRAHRLVLSACSPLLRDMLSSRRHARVNQQTPGMIFLHGVRHKDAAAILSFMYQGEVNVNQEDLQAFLAAAEDLRIRGLSDRGGGAEGGTKGNSSASNNDSGKGGKQRAGSASPPPSSSSTPANSKPPNKRVGSPADGEEGKATKRRMVVTPDVPSDYADDSRGADGGGGPDDIYGDGDPFGAAFHHRGGSGGPRDFVDDEDGPNGLSGSYPNLMGHGDDSSRGFTMHELGGRDDLDPFSRMRVLHSARGWHCPRCPHVSTTKGNLKAHIVSGRHRLGAGAGSGQGGFNVGNATLPQHQPYSRQSMDKAFECEFCGRHYSTRQSLRVHISTRHREQRDAARNSQASLPGLSSSSSSNPFGAMFNSSFSPSMAHHLAATFGAAGMAAGDDPAGMSGSGMDLMKKMAAAREAMADEEAEVEEALLEAEQQQRQQQQQHSSRREEEQQQQHQEQQPYQQQQSGNNDAQQQASSSAMHQQQQQQQPSAVPDS